MAVLCVQTDVCCSGVTQQGTFDTGAVCNPRFSDNACKCRFEVEDCAPILYVYEVQLEQSAQRKGLGPFLMTFLKLYAKKNKLERIMLTVMDVGS